jgi:hypothetical protein
MGLSLDVSGSGISLALVRTFHMYGRFSSFFYIHMAEARAQRQRLAETRKAARNDDVTTDRAGIAKSSALIVSLTVLMLGGLLAVGVILRVAAA